jgi:hypothetical protein
VDEDSGQATPLLSKGFVDGIMAGSFAVWQSKMIPSAICEARRVFSKNGNEMATKWQLRTVPSQNGGF